MIRDEVGLSVLIDRGEATAADLLASFNVHESLLAVSVCIHCLLKAVPDPWERNQLAQVFGTSAAKAVQRLPPSGGSNVVPLRGRR